MQTQGTKRVDPPPTVAEFLAHLDVAQNPPSLLRWLCRFPADLRVLDFRDRTPAWFVEDRWRVIGDYPGYAIWVVRAKDLAAA